MKYHIEFDLDFKRNKAPGKYIVIEGIDGSGKTTQVERLTEYLHKKGKPVVPTREPRKGTGLIGELIQKILQGKTTIPSIAFQYLFTADRAMHHAELILPSLAKGDIVVSDRCFWSTIPYGIMDREGAFDPKTAEFLMISQSILSFYHQFTIPDYTFYLDVPLDLAMKRLKAADGETEIYEHRGKLAKTLKGYDWLLQKFPKEFIVIDAAKSVEQVTEDIISHVNKIL